MAFPTSGLVDNQVHKEGNRSFIYDSTLLVWDQAPEAPDTISILGASTGLDNVTLGSSTVFPGHVIQVLQTVKTNKQVGTADGSVNWLDIDGLRQAITPSSTSNKILINISVSYGSASYSGYMRIQARTASGAYSDLAVGDNTGTTGQSKITMGTVGGTADPAEITTASAMFLDSPNTTSERTYKVQFTSRHTDTMTINYAQSNVNADYIGVGISSITLMEIAG